MVSTTTTITVRKGACSVVSESVAREALKVDTLHVDLKPGAIAIQYEDGASPDEIAEMVRKVKEALDA